ncbi:putative plastid-lipid-associated protein 11, partial [Mucuna pruriens]
MENLRTINIHVHSTWLPQYLPMREISALNRQFFQVHSLHRNHGTQSSPPTPTPMATLLLPNLFTTKLPAPRYSHRRFTCSSITTQSRPAKEYLLALIADQDRGLRTQRDPAKRAAIVEAIDAMTAVGAGSVTTGDSLSATWRLLWTTEKEQLFIIDKAPLFGTRSGDVLQVIDVRERTLNNVITFPPDGVFFVRSHIEVASPQRVNFSITWEDLGNTIATIWTGLKLRTKKTDAKMKFKRKSKNQWSGGKKMMKKGSK